MYIFLAQIALCESSLAIGPVQFYILAAVYYIACYFRFKTLSHEDFNFVSIDFSSCSIRG